MSVATPWMVPKQWKRIRQQRFVRRWLRMARFDDPATQLPPSTLPRALDGAYRDFEAFFWQFQHKVYGYLLRLVSDPDTARDLCQETFLRAWEHFDEIAAHRDNGGWLFRVASNLAFNFLRQSATPTGAASRLMPERISMRDPNDALPQHELVMSILAKLTPKQRAALILHEVYDLTCEDIGQTLGMTRDAVKMALFRAREHFARLYLSEEDEA